MIALLASAVGVAVYMWKCLTCGAYWCAHNGSGKLNLDCLLLFVVADCR
jgi:hypothetical protein